jgi:hypothetical protein
MDGIQQQEEIDGLVESGAERGPLVAEIFTDAVAGSQRRKERRGFQCPSRKSC